MEKPTVEEILNMKTYQLKEYLEDKHVPVPKKQSKEFLQTAALQTHADLEAEASKRQIITRRRSKREESDGSTYSGMYGRSSSIPRSSPSSNSSPSTSPSITTRSRVYVQAKSEKLHSPRRKLEEGAAINAQQEEDLSYSSYSGLIQSAIPSTPPLTSIDFNQPIDDAGEHRQTASTPPPKQTHVEPNAHSQSAAYASVLAMRAHQENTDVAVPQSEVIKESIKASDHLNESNRKTSRPNQEVVKKIIRVSDEVDHQDKVKGTKNHQGARLKGHHGAPGERAPGQESRMQRLKRSANMIMSQMNERVLKRLRKLPNNCRLNLVRPSPHVSIALLMCALCIAAIGAATYWYHLKKLEEQRARKRWLW